MKLPAFGINSKGTPRTMENKMKLEMEACHQIFKGIQKYIYNF